MSSPKPSPSKRKLLGAVLAAPLVLAVLAALVGMVIDSPRVMAGALSVVGMFWAGIYLLTSRAS